MWSISKDWKAGYVIKIRPTEKRSTCISRLELKIKKIIVYRWTFTKVSLKLTKVLWVIHNYIWCNKLLCNDGPSEKVLYKTGQNLPSLIENYIMEGNIGLLFKKYISSYIVTHLLLFYFRYGNNLITCNCDWWHRK